MALDGTHTKSDQNRKVEALRKDCRYWQSTLRFMEDEMKFINQLLTSYVFEPNTPNLFERLQDYLERLKKAQDQKGKVKDLIVKYQSGLGGMLECTDDNCDFSYYQKHDRLKAEVVQCTEDFQLLKGEIFNYAGGILKMNKTASSNDGQD